MHTARARTLTLNWESKRIIVFSPLYLGTYFFFSQAESDWPLCAVELNSAMYAAKVRMVKAGKYGKRGKGAEGTIPKLVLASLGE